MADETIVDPKFLIDGAGANAGMDAYAITLFCDRGFQQHVGLQCLRHIPKQSAIVLELKRTGAGHRIQTAYTLQFRRHSLR